MPPVPPSPSETSRRMAKVRQSGTKAEMELRREIYRHGLRYRVNVEVLRRPRRVADIVFRNRKIAILVDGCFWHGCPEHATWPKRNQDFWREKIEANRRRDADTNARLRNDGWTVLRVWEHESPVAAARRVMRLVSEAPSTARTPRRTRPSIRKGEAPN